MRRAFSAVVVVSIAALALAAGAYAGNGKGGTDNGQHLGQYKDTGGDFNNGKALPFLSADNEKITGQEPLGPAKIGVVRTWLALNDVTGGIYLKNYQLRAVGQHIEMWVATNLNFPAGDCRNAYVNITDAQLKSFVTEFDTNIYPKESATFAVPPALNGHKAVLPTLIPNLPSSEYKGEGGNIVVLIDNVRDANYYAPNTPDGQTFIAGFFWSTFNNYFNRNVMTIDAFDWTHRTGANPPNDAGSTGCALVSGNPKPHSYEGVFAHEYQHLLEHYSDGDETSWVNEGLSDWAQTLVGYIDPSIPHGQVGSDGHINCMLGWLDPAFGGPENSLTLWGDQGGPEILCDYGAAYTFMQYLATRYGDGFMTALHRAPGNGLVGLDAVLASQLTGKTARQTLHDWAAMLAVDAHGGTGEYSSTGLFGDINWANSQSYDSPGAPPNGSDYIRLQDATGGYVPAASLTNVSFSGSSSFPPGPVEWTVDGGALYSGTGDEIDRAIIRSVSVPAATPTLTFQQRYDLEQYWDFGFVQVSTNGGASYTSLACPGTTSVYDPGAYPTVKTNVPGYTGVSGWTGVTCDLSAYAGQTVLLSFRNITDWGTQGNGAGTPGWWIDDIAVGGVTISDGSSLAGWQSATQISPITVEGYTVRLVSYRNDGTLAKVSDVPLTGNSGSLSGAALAAAIAPGADVVAALVMFDESTELVSSYPTYTLTVNGVTQPGGS